MNTAKIPPGLFRKLSGLCTFLIIPSYLCWFCQVEYVVRLSHLNLSRNDRLKVEAHETLHKTGYSNYTSETKMEKVVSTCSDLFSFSSTCPSLPKDADNMNNFATLLGKLSKVWQGRLEVINYSNVSSEPCCLRRAGLYNMHVRRHDETTP